MRERENHPYCELRTIHKGGPLCMMGWVAAVRGEGRGPAANATLEPRTVAATFPGTLLPEPVKERFEHPSEKDARGTGDHQPDRGSASAHLVTEAQPPRRLLLLPRLPARLLAARAGGAVRRPYEACPCARPPWQTRQR